MSGGKSGGGGDGAIAPGSALPPPPGLRLSDDTALRHGALAPESSSRKMRRPRPPSGSIPVDWVEGKVVVNELKNGYSSEAGSRGVALPVPAVDEMGSSGVRNVNNFGVVGSALETVTVDDGAVRDSNSPANSYHTNGFKLFSHVEMEKKRRAADAGENNDDHDGNDDNGDGCWRSGLSLRSTSSSKFAGDYNATGGHNVHREGRPRLDDEDEPIAGMLGVLPGVCGEFTPSSYRDDDDEGEPRGFFATSDGKRSFSISSDVIGSGAGAKARDGLASSSLSGGVAVKTTGSNLAVNDGGGVVAGDAGAAASAEEDDDHGDDDVPPDLPAMTIQFYDVTMESEDEALPSYEETSAAAVAPGRRV